MDLPPAYRKALNTDTPERDLPLKKDQLQSLGDFLRKNFTDPRRANLAAVHRYGQFLTQAHRGWLGFGRKKDSNFRKVPSYTALRNLLIKIDPHQLADCLNQWLQAHLGTLPRALAVDGKWIRDRALSLCLSDHQTGAPVAMGFAKEKAKTDDQQSKDKYKREGEQTIALRLYATTNLENATVTGDALNNNKPQARAVLDGGGDYFFQLKNENRHAYKAAVQKSKASPLLPTQKCLTLTIDGVTSPT